MLGNPLKSESSAFGWLVVVAVAALSVILLAVLIDPLVGAIWLGALALAGLVLAVRAALAELRR